MHAIVVLVLVLGGLAIVATPIVAANMLKIWPVSLIYAAGIAVYLVVVVVYAVWRRRRTVQA